MPHHFEADFKDGTTYIQGSDDVSIDAKDKNAFYDILQREEDVIRFHITDEQTNDRWSVDLVDGHFELNGVPFRVHNKGMEHPYQVPEGPFKLIYFKVKQERIVLGEDGSATPLKGLVLTYCMGWQTNLGNGENLQQVIAVG